MFHFFFTGGNSEGKFSINPDSGVLSCVQPLDRETFSNYELLIMATDGTYQNTCTMYIVVKDQNDNDPEFLQEKYAKIIYEDVTVGSFVIQVSAQDVDEGDNGKVSYSLSDDPDGSMFEIDDTSGEIRTKGYDCLCYLESESR